MGKKKIEKEPSDGVKIVAVNRKAGYDYELLERMEAGLVLLGTEVKSARQGKLNLKDSYAAPDNGELFLVQCHISSWTHAHFDNHDPLRRRKLLMRRREIRRLIGKITERGLTVIPTRAYFRNGRLKVELALAKGKRHHDRRAALRERDIEREAQADLKERNR